MSKIGNVVPMKIKKTPSIGNFKESIKIGYLRTVLAGSVGHIASIDFIECL